MTRRGRRITVLVADRDAEGRRMMGEAFAARRPDCDLRFAGNGEELMDYLRRRGPYSDPARSPRPGLLLLGWDLPGRSGPESLWAIRADPALRPLPVVVLGASEAGGDVDRAYDLGAAAFVRKPTTPQGMAGFVEAVGGYWLDVVELPDMDKGDADELPPR